MAHISLAAAVLAFCGLAGGSFADELIVTSTSGIVKSIDLDTGEVGNRGVCTGAVRSLAVADGVLYLGGSFGDIYVFDLATNQVVGEIAFTGEAHAMAWDGQRLLVANSDTTIISVDPDQGIVTGTTNVPLGDLTAIGIDSGGLYAGGGLSALRSHIGHGDFQTFAACGSMIRAMAFSADTMFLVGTSFNGSTGTVYKFDKFVGGVNYEGTFPTPNDPRAALAYGGRVYIGGADGVVHEMDPGDGAILRSFDMGLEVSGIAPTTGLVSCAADYDISGGLNFFDISLFLGLFNDELPAADTDGNGVFNFFDVQGYLDIYNAGCP